MTTSTQTYGKLLEYEQYIDHQLQRTQKLIKTNDVLTASLTLFVAILAVLFVEVVLDHLVGLSLWLRWGVLMAGIAGAGAFAFLRIFLPLVRRVSGLYAAKAIEEMDPKFKNSLITYLDLRRRRKEVSKSAMAAIEAKAVKDLTQVELDAVVNQRRLMQAWYALAAVTVVASLYWMLSPKSTGDSIRRAFLADVVRPTNTRLLNIQPGNDPAKSRVAAGALVQFAVDVDGVRPSSVRLHYSVDGGKYYSVKEFTPGANAVDPWTCEMKDVQQSLNYYLTGGDAESLKYHLEVLPAPMVTHVSLDYDFPEYTGIKPIRNVEGGNVEALEGTIVTVHARTNEPSQPHGATLDFSKAAPELMEVSSKDATELTGRFKVKESGSYTIRYRTTGGQVNSSPVVYDIVAIPDRTPTASFTTPEKDTINVPSNVQVLLGFTASDDHGVKDVSLHVHQGSEVLQPAVNLLESRPPQREYQGHQVLDLEKLKVRPGTDIQYWLTVRDVKTPQSNKFETPHRTIKIVAPVDKSQKQTNDDRVKEGEARAQEQEKAAAQNAASEEPQAGANGQGGQGQGQGQQGEQGTNEPDQQAGNGNANASRRPGQGNRDAGGQENGPQGMADPDDRKTLEKLSQGLNKVDKGTKGSGAGASGQGKGQGQQRSKLEEPKDGKGDFVDPTRQSQGQGSNPDAQGARPSADGSSKSGANPPANPQDGGAGNKASSPDVERANRPNDAGQPGQPGGSAERSSAGAEEKNATSSKDQVQRGSQGPKMNPPATPGQSGGAGDKQAEKGPNPPGAETRAGADSEKSGSSSKSNGPNDRSSAAPKTGDKTAAKGAGDRSNADRGAQEKPGEKGTGPAKGDRQGSEGDSGAAPKDGESRQGADSKTGGPRDRAGDQGNEKPRAGMGEKPNGETGSRADNQGNERAGSQAGNAGKKDGADEQGGATEKGASRPDKNAQDRAGMSKPGDKGAVGPQGREPGAAGREEKPGDGASAKAPSGDQPSGAKDAQANKEKGAEGASSKGEDRGAGEESGANKPSGANRDGASGRENSGKPGEKGTSNAPGERQGTSPKDRAEGPQEKGAGGKPDDRQERTPGGKPSAKSEEGSRGARNERNDRQAGAGEKSTGAGSQAPGEKAGQQRRGNNPAGERSAAEAMKGEPGSTGEKSQNGTRSTSSPSDKASSAKGAEGDRPEAGAPKPGDEASPSRENRPGGQEAPRGNQVATKDDQTAKGAREAAGEPKNGEKGRASSAPGRPDAGAQERAAQDRTGMGDERQGRPGTPNRPDEKASSGRGAADKQDAQAKGRRASEADGRDKPQPSGAEKQANAEEAADRAAADRNAAEERNATRTEQAKPPTNAEESRAAEGNRGMPEREAGADAKAQRQRPGQADRNAREEGAGQDRAGQESAANARGSREQGRKGGSPAGQKDEKGRSGQGASSKGAPSGAKPGSERMPSGENAEEGSKPAGSNPRDGSEQGKAGGERPDASGPPKDGSLRGQKPGEGGQPKPSDESGKPGSPSGTKPENADRAAAGREQEGGEPGRAGESPKRGSQPSSEPGSSPAQGEQGTPSGTQSEKGQESNGEGPSQGQASQNARQAGGNPRGGGRNAAGGGGPRPAGPDEPMGPEEKPEPSKTVPSKPQDLEETIAPRNITQPDLVLRKIQDILKDDKATAKLEEATGMDRAQIEQFVKKFDKKVPQGTTREGRELKVKPGENQAMGPSENLPGINSRTTFGSRAERGPNAVAADETRGNNQGGYLEPPAELRSRVRAYSSTLLGTKSGRSAKPSPAPGR